MSAEGPRVDNLFPAIAQSFAVILLGYIFGLFKIIPPGEARAINELVGKLALPALLFQNLATLDLSAICWKFMAGILIAKSSVFVLTALITLIMSRNIGKAGLFGIFTTQSNDFALGLPIVLALYGPGPGVDNFDYSSYIYLVAPISLVIINPVGFLMMESWKQSQNQRLTVKSMPKLVFNISKGVAFNPIVFMTAFGVIYNLVVHFGIFHGKESSQRNIPHWLGGFLTMLANAYSACALLQIGIFMVGKVKKNTGILIIISALLIFAKTILFPILTDRVLYLLLSHEGSNATQSANNISTFGFLYGTFPTAPTVFVYSNQYNIAMDIVASSIVLCTFLSAPIMYVSARLVLITKASDSQYDNIIQNTRQDVTAVALIGLAWVFLIFVLARRYRSILHVMVMHYMAALVLEALGGELLQVFKDKDEVYWQIFAFALFFPGVLASRIWTAWISVGLGLILYRGHQTADKAWLSLMISAWGVPVVITLAIVIASTVDPRDLHNGAVDVTFLFGNIQLIVSAITLLFSFIVGFTFMVASAMKMNKGTKPVLHSSNNVSATNNDQVTKYGSTNDTLEKTRDESQGGVLKSLTRSNSGNRVNKETPAQSVPNHEISAIHFLVLLLFLLFSCLVGILIVLWKLIDSNISGIFIGLNVLDTTTNFGQGFFVFIMFGFEKHWFWIVIYKRIRHLLFNIEQVSLPSDSELNSTVKVLCSEFKHQHLHDCKNAIESDRRYYMRMYQDVFAGSDLVDWLLREGIAATREEGTEYGHSLLLGRVLTHVTNEHYFYDDRYFYRFTV